MNHCQLPIEALLSRIERLLPGSPVEEILLGRLLGTTHQRLAEAKSKALQQEGLNETLFMALFILFTADDQAMQPSELSLMLGASRTSGTRVADELVLRGWVVRAEVEGDRRCQLLQLTEAGRVFLTELLPRQRVLIRQLWSPLSDEERAEFTRLLRKMLDALPE